jgi:hypothetical protein
MTYKKSAGGRAASFMASTCLVLLLNFTSGILTARALSVVGRGELAAIVIWVQNLGWVFALGVTEAIQYFSHSKPSDRLITTFMVLGGAYGLLGILVAQIALPFAFQAQSPDVLLLARIAVIAIPQVVITEYAKALLAGRHEMWILNAWRIAQPALYVVILATLWMTKTTEVRWVLFAHYGTGFITLATPRWIGSLREKSFITEPASKAETWRDWQTKDWTKWCCRR